MKLKRMSAVVTALVLSAGMLLMVGCGKKIDPSDPQTLQVYVYNAGYGYQWCEDILDAFKEEEWVKEKYPNLVIDFDKNELDTYGGDQLSRGESNDYDLLFGQSLKKPFLFQNALGRLAFADIHLTAKGMYVKSAVGQSPVLFRHGKASC